MSSIILLASAALIICILFDKATDRIGVPALLTFIAVGMLFGTDGIFRYEFDDFNFADDAASFALILIMFYGGFDTNWKAARPVAVQSVLLSSLGVLLTALFTGTVIHYLLGWNWLDGLLIGAVLGSTDAASVFSILKSRRLNLRYNSASMLEVESGSNDPAAYMMTMILIALMIGGDINIPTMLVKQLAFGVGFGVIVAGISLLIMYKISFPSGFRAVFLLAAALLAYALPDMFGGNGYLAAYLAGIIIGNNNKRRRKELVHFFDGTVGLMQIMLFFLLGLLSTPSKLPAVLPDAIVIFLVILLISRPAAVLILLAPFRCPRGQMLLTAWSGLRGASSIVFAIMAKTSLADRDDDIFHLVFMVVIFSIILQGTLLPYAAKVTGMIDDNEDVRRTFNDYAEKGAVQFLQFEVDPDHAWANRKVRDITIPPDTLLVLIQRLKHSAVPGVRKYQNIVPDGDTEIISGDRVILSGRAVESVDGLTLAEDRIAKADAGKVLAEYASVSNTLVILIRRGSEVIIPSGQTVLKKDDILVTYTRDKQDELPKPPEITPNQENAPSE